MGRVPNKWKQIWSHSCCDSLKLNVVLARRKPAKNGCMITLKTTDKKTGDIRKGERYVSFTDQDKRMVEGAAKKLGLTHQGLVNEAPRVFGNKDGVQGFPPGPVCVILRVLDSLGTPVRLGFD